MRVYLTGATGLVGRHVAAQLRADGHDVHALVRDASGAGALERAGCTLVVGDILDDAASLASGMRDCDALVHAAALLGARASRDRYRTLNVAGTASVFEAAERAGVRRAVHVSSVAVYGTIDGNITEDRWRESPIHANAFYAWSKRAAEEEAWKHDRVGGLRVSAVRPALIYGEHDRHVARRLDRLVRAPILPLPDGGRWTLPLVYAGNVARGIVRCLTRPVAEGRAYNLAQDNTTPLADAVRSWCAARGIRPPIVLPVPGAALEAGARVVDVLSRIAPGLDLPGARRPARLLRADNPYDSSRARLELDWTDHVPLEVAFQRTAAWLDENTNHNPEPA